MPRTTLNLQAIENKQEQDKKQTLTDLIELGFCFKYPGGLADTRVYKEVAKAKLTSNKNPSSLVAASCLNRGIERSSNGERNSLGSFWTPRLVSVIDSCLFRLSRHTVSVHIERQRQFHLRGVLRSVYEHVLQLRTLSSWKRLETGRAQVTRADEENSDKRQAPCNC